MNDQPLGLSPARILVVDADDAARARLERAASGSSMELRFARGEEAAARIAVLDPPDVVVIDPGAELSAAARVLSRLRLDLPLVPFVLLWDGARVDALGQTRALGGFDLLGRGAPAEQATMVLGRALEFAGLTRENAELKRRLTQQAGPVSVTGRSAATERLRESIRWVASSSASVLIQGESGSGKEQVARAIHSASARAHGAFLKVSCAALPPALLESELFGVEGGAADRGVRSAPGCLARAREGSLLLDEISELSPSLQPKLLRALTERVYLPLGGVNPEPLRARLLVTTHADPEALVRAGRLREELRQFLGGVVLTVPPLRERREDITLLALQILSGNEEAEPGNERRLSATAMERLLEHDWPGNVRELRNVLERAALLAAQGEIRPEQIILDRGAGGAVNGTPARVGDTLHERERAWIQQVLRETGGNRSATARRLDVSVRTIRNKLALYRREDLRRGDAEEGSLRPAA